VAELLAAIVGDVGALVGGVGGAVGAAVGAGGGEVKVGEGSSRGQGGARAAWLQLLMAGSYLVPAGQRYLWPPPGPVHRRKAEQEEGSAWYPGEVQEGREEGRVGGSSSNTRDRQEDQAILTWTAQWYV